MSDEFKFPSQDSYEHRTIQQTVVQVLHDAITQGHLVPGQKLVYLEIADQLNVSVTRVREAVKTLEAMGMVTIHPHRTAFVSYLTGEQLEQLYVLRTLLEGMAARPLSTDLAAWQQIYHHDPSYYLSTNLPTVPGSLNVQVNETFSETVNNAHTWSANAGFSASAKKMGLINFGEELNINFSMDVKTTTVMSYSLGFWLNLPGCTQTGCCISELDIDPAIYVPNDEASGYNAPWISNDIRNFQKPKPWCLSYEILNPINPCPSGVGSTPSRLTVRKLEGTLFLDQNDQNRNKVSVKLRLEGIAPDFSLDDPEVVYMRLGNYAVNSDRNYVVSWYFKGKDLVLKLKETEESKSSLLVKLSYDSRKSILDIDLNADRIDLIHLFQSYGLGTGDEVPEHQDKTVPLRFFLGDRYVADAEMNTRCTTNNQHVICNLHSK